MGRASRRLCRRRRGDHGPKYGLGGNRYFPVAASAELHDHVFVRLSGGSVHRRDLPIMVVHRYCGSRRHAHSAAADGTVSIANGTDSWGGSYGYHVKDRTCWFLWDSLRSLFLNLCNRRTAGQTGREVIACVGTTGFHWQSPALWGCGRMESGWMHWVFSSN